MARSVLDLASGDTRSQASRTMWRRHQPAFSAIGFRKIPETAFRHWEIRRIIFNLIVLPPGWIVYLLVAGIEDGVGDTRYLGTAQVVVLASVAILVLNLCYSSVYALELLPAFANARSAPASARTLVFSRGACSASS